MGDGKKRSGSVGVDVGMSDVWSGTSAQRGLPVGLHFLGGDLSFKIIHSYCLELPVGAPPMVSQALHPSSSTGDWRLQTGDWQSKV